MFFGLSLSAYSHEDPHVSVFKQQSCVESFFKALCESQIYLYADLVGPDQSRSWLTEMLHGEQKLIHIVMKVDHVCRQHVVIMIEPCGVGVLQIITPRQNIHLGHVAAKPPGVPHHISPQVTLDMG